MKPDYLSDIRANETSLDNFYFCNASSGYPDFALTFWTGTLLYQRLSGDVLLGAAK